VSGFSQTELTGNGMASSDVVTGVTPSARVSMDMGPSEVESSSSDSSRPLFVSESPGSNWTPRYECFHLNDPICTMICMYVGTKHTISR
jgi:hypothetical protein